MTTVRISDDALALACGADAVAAAFAAAGCTVERVSSWGMHWLEPLVEIDGLGFGPANAADVAAIPANAISGIAETTIPALSSDEWQRAHLTNPRDVVPESNMPAFAFLANTKAKDSVGANVEAKMELMRGYANVRGIPTYTDEEIKGAKAAIGEMTEMDVLIAYLQGMGLELKNAK